MEPEAPDHAKSREKELEEKLQDTKKWLNAEIGLKTLELHEKNLELEEALNRVESLNQTKSEFLRIVSHELRTPLNGIIGTAYLLKDMAKTPEQIELMDLLDVSVRRLEAFAYTALQISELQAMNSRLKKTPVMLPEYLEEVKQIIGFEKHNRMLRINNSCSGNPVMINKPLLTTALTRIFDNAVRFSPVNSEINLTTTTEAEGTHFVITDEGPGFAGEILLRKFEPFVTAESHVDQNPGMSLALVRFIIEAHGGKIDLFNTRQGGAMVDFFIP
jgi:signal transduction histidine kinase